MLMYEGHSVLNSFILQMIADSNKTKYQTVFQPKKPVAVVYININITDNMEYYELVTSCTHTHTHTHTHANTQTYTQ